MSGTRVFFDTNVLLYLLSADSAKADRAEGLLVEGGVISVQVLNEFAAVASRKLRMNWLEIEEILRSIRSVCEVEPLTVQIHDHGLALAQRYGFSVYDSLIWASAIQSGCTILYSEDMQDGQSIDIVTLHDPFSLL